MDRAFQAGLANGGPSGLVYGFLFTWIGSGLQVLVMAELASMFVNLKMPADVELILFS